MNQTDYAKSHHLWRPMAALSGSEEMENELTSSKPVHKSKLNFTIKTIANVITEITSIKYANDENSVWQPAMMGGELNGSYYFNDTRDNYLDMYNVTSESYGNLTNSSYSGNEEMIRLLTMIGTAVVLGLLILATVIGKLFRKFIFPRRN